MVHQRSWNLWNDWKEVAHGGTCYRNQKKSNKKSSWKWKSWTACDYVGCGVWVYDHQKRSFCLQCIRPLPEPTPVKSEPVTPACSPVVKVLEVLLAAADQIGWLGRDTLAAILSTMQGKTKTKATTPEAELAQKETEYNKASSNERFVEKVQASTEAVELKVEGRDLHGLAPSLFRPRKTRNSVWRTCVLCALLYMVLAQPLLETGSGLHRWNRTPTVSSRKNRAALLRGRSGR